MSEFRNEMRKALIGAVVLCICIGIIVGIGHGVIKLIVFMPWLLYGIPLAFVLWLGHSFYEDVIE